MDYTIKCKDCGKEEKSALVGIDCKYCQSQNIETWKDGKLHNPRSIPIKPNEGDKYAGVCSDCKEKWSCSYEISTCCPSCKSRNIKVYDDKGFLQILPSNDNKKNKGLDSDNLALVIITNIIFWPLVIWLIIRWRRKKKNKQNN